MIRSMLLLLLVTFITRPTIGHAQAGDRFPEIAPLIQQAIASGKLPGAVVCFADATQIRYLNTFGDRQIHPQQQPMTADTVFDLASLTKPLATATSIVILDQQGKIKTSDPVSMYMPEFKGHGKEKITIEQCLTHTSGLTPDNSLSDYQDGQDAAWKKICELKLRSDPGEKFAYSDVGFIVLGELISRISGKPLDKFTSDQIFSAMKMDSTGFHPAESLRQRSAPTTLHHGKWLKGTVHDPRAARLGGVAGHAGLFSTATDLVAFGQNLLAASKGFESAVLSKAAFEKMTAPRTTPRGTRTLGWDHQSPYSSNRGTALSDKAFGHGGFTGTVLWIDPEKELIFVFLSSRLHPDGEGSVNQLAGRVVNVVAPQW